MPALEYHIHVDGQENIPERAKAWFLEHGFWPDQFVPVDKDPGFQPHDHLSHETSDKVLNDRLRRETYAFLRANPTLVVGYVESEAIVSRATFDDHPFDPSVPLPVRLTIRPIAEILEVVPSDWFRQSEIHVTSRKDQTDPRLIDALKRIGLYTAHYVSAVDDQLYVIFTVQGYQRDVARLSGLLTGYLHEAGGTCNAAMQFEVVTGSWKRSSNIPLPPIIDPSSFR